MKDESALTRAYGLQNKRELWKMRSIMEGFKDQAKSLMAKESVQAAKEEGQLLQKLMRLKLLTEGSKVENVLALELKHLMDRRLQSLVYSKGLARSMKQARQFIIHGHVMVGNHLLTVPSYLVPLEEEAQILFDAQSALSSLEHPERVQVRPDITTQLKTAEPASGEASAPAPSAVEVKA